MNHASRITHYDIYLVGVGGQGLLTIGELLAEAALAAGWPANFYPTKGMAQRGGFVKAQLRLGRDPVGPNIPEGGAHLVIALELSESLKAVRFARPGGDFLLFGQIWAPLAVTLGQAMYPSLEQVRERIQEAGGVMHYIEPEALPLYEGAPVPANIYVLGAVIGRTGLGCLLPAADVEAVVRRRWRRGVERNVFTFRAGLASDEE